MIRAKKLFIFIMAGVISFSGISVPATLRADATDVPVYETNVEEASSGNIMIGVPGTLYSTTENEMLTLMNSVRKEAYDEKLEYPIGSGKHLGVDYEYTPLKWSSALEKAARMRAVDVCFTAGHSRPSGSSIWFNVDGVSSNGEVIAWNSSVLNGIKNPSNSSDSGSWYSEKAYYLQQIKGENMSAVIGHYEAMIKPENKYVGLSAFKPDYGIGYLNSWLTVVGRFSQSSTSLDQTFNGWDGECVHKVEVKANTASLSIVGDNAIYAGESRNYDIDVNVKTSSGYGAEHCKLYTAGSWSSSDSSVFTVNSSSGRITAKGVGSAELTYTLTSGNTTLTANKTIIVLPTGVDVVELVNPETITVNTGTKPDMPKTVKALLSNGNYIDVDVIWDDIPNDYQNSKSYSYWQETTFNVKGVFQTYEVYQPIHVIPQIDRFILEYDTVTVNSGTKPTYPKATKIYLTNGVYYSNQTLTWADNDLYNNREGGTHEIEGTFSFNNTKKAKVTLIVNPMTKKSTTVNTADITIVSGTAPVLPKAIVTWADNVETEEDITWVKDDDFINGYKKPAGYTYTVTGSYGGKTYTINVKVVNCLHQHLTTHQAKTPTCVADGNILYYSCDDCDMLFSDDTATTAVSLAAVTRGKTGHQFGTPTYTWKNTPTVSCHGVSACTNTGCTEKITEDANITSVVAKTATCTEVGSTKYTAAFTDSHFSTQNKTYDDIDATGHSYSEPKYTWSEDGKSCVAECVCGNDTTHIQKEVGTITSKVKSDSTCIKMGTTEYTAAFTNKPFLSQTKDVEDIPKKPHSGGTATCTKRAVCSYCHTEYGAVDPDNHVNTICVNKKKKTCTEAGYSGDIRCADCDKLLSTGETDLPEGHIFSAWKTVRKPSETQAGLKQRICTECGETEEETIAMPPQTTKEDESDTETPIDKTDDDIDVEDDPFDEESEDTDEELEDEETGATYVVLKTKDGSPEVSFDGCSKEQSKVEIPSKVEINGVTYKITSVSSEAFKGDTKLTSVKVGDNIETIAESAFEDCKNLTTVTLGKNVTTIGDDAFNGCKKLKKVKLPAKVTSIGEDAFRDCKKLTTITIGAKVKDIRDNAFRGCTALKKIIIPANVKRLGAFIFANNKALRTIVIKTKKLTAKTVDPNAFKGVSNKVTIKVPKEKLKFYTTLFRKKGLSAKVKIKKN